MKRAVAAEQPRAKRSGSEKPIPICKKTVAQARENAAAADLAPFSVSEMAAVGAVYDEEIRGVVHARW